MITSASDLLAAFIAKEVDVLRDFDMRHMPTLGSAYEAIARVGIEQGFVLPHGLDLRVVSGFIQGLDNQFDALLVQGPGQRYGLTDQYTYPIDKVLCAFEVKKTLTKSEFVDALNHLAAVQSEFGRHFATLYENNEIRPDVKRAARTFAQVTGRKGPETVRALGSMSLSDRAMFGALVRQQYAPVTVLLGFGGYATEHGLRKGLLDILESHAGKASSASVDLMPTLVTANTHSLVKCAHQPYLLRRTDGRWVFLASTRHNPARILLELLWTKISNYCNVRMPWGHDMEVETLKELLLAEAVEHDGSFGWKYTSFEYSEKRLHRPEMLQWEPATLSAAAMSVVNLLGLRGGHVVLDQRLDDFVSKNHKVALSEVLQELIDSSVFGRSENELHVIGQSTIVGQLDNGSGVVANEREKLERWCASKGLTPTFMTIIAI